MPRFEPIPSPFQGGLIRAREANERKDAVLHADFTYWDGKHWVILDRDYGVALDTDEKVGVWAAYWDIAGLKPGKYRLRVEMYAKDGGYGVATVEVNIAPAPIGRVTVQSASPAMATFSAAGMSDPAGGELRHDWIFDDGRRVAGATTTLDNPVERPWSLFQHTATTSVGGAATDVHLFHGGILLSLVDHQIDVTLGAWAKTLRDIATEKVALKAKLNPDNQKHVDTAVEKLRQAADKIDEAKRLLKQAPPDLAGARRLLEQAQQLIDAAIADLDAVTQERGSIDDNLRRLRGVLAAIPVALLEADYLIDRAKELSDIIAEKRALAGLNATEQAALKDALDLLDAAKALLDDAEKALLATPPDFATARAKIDAAREKIKEAGKKLEGVKPPPKAFTDNIERLKQLYLKLAFLSGKIWLLEQITTANPHAGIPLPDLTRDHDTATYTTKGEIEMGPKDDPVNDDGWEPDVTYHELDHWFLFQKNHRDLPGGRHWYDEDLGKPPRGPADGKKLAWSEGWANFSSCAKRKDPHYYDEGEETRPKDTHFTPEKDLERDQCKNPADPAMHPNANSGPTVEGSVSGILWDLFDGPANGVADGDNDGVSIPFRWLWQALNEMVPPDDIYSFYNSLKGVLAREHIPFDGPKLDKIFTDHGVPLPPP